MILHAAEQTDGLVSACLQAEAAIHAARIQATAARQAGTMGLFAGLAALAATVVAYRAARVQIRLAENQHRSRVIAYRQHLQILLQQSLAEIGTYKDQNPKINVTSWSGLVFSNTGLSGLVSIEPELAPNLWEDHALLGSDFSEQVFKAWFSIKSTLRVSESLGVLQSNYKRAQER